MNRAQQTREGIARAKANGVVWGAYSAVLAMRNRQQADLFAESLRHLILQLMASEHRGPVMLARELNRRGIPTSRGGKWHPATVQRLLKRLPGFKDELRKADEERMTKVWAELRAEYGDLEYFRKKPLDGPDPGP